MEKVKCQYENNIHLKVEERKLIWEEEKEVFVKKILHCEVSEFQKVSRTLYSAAIF